MKNLKFCTILRVEFTENGLVKEQEDWEEYILTIDRTSSLDQAFKEISNGRYRLPLDAKNIANGDFYSHLKSSSRILDTSGREPCYRWESSNLCNLFLHAFNLDLLAYRYWRPPLEDEWDPDPSWEDMGFLDELKGNMYF